MIRKICRKLMLTALLFVLSFGARASHLYGGELYYTNLSGNLYKVTMILYGDCSGPSSVFSALYTATPKVEVLNGSTVYRTLYLNVTVAGLEITPVCPAFLSSTTCNGGTVPGVRKFVYEDTVTLNTSSANWKFRSTGYLTAGTSSGRSASITNVSMAGGGSIMALEATLNNSSASNSNPTFTSIPTPFFCINAAQEYNMGAVDPNTGDSLAYTLVDGFDASSTPMSTVTYATGYSATAPLATTPGTFSFSAKTGQLTFTPNLAQKSIVVVKVSEYRSGVLIGSSMREMTFIVLSTCSNRSPFGKISNNSAGKLIGNTSLSICKANTNLTFNINPIDSDANNITMSVAGLPAGASLTVSNNGTTTPTSVFSWNISGVAAGTYIFYVTYQDDGCPLNSKQNVAYSITILPVPQINVSTVSNAGCVKKAVYDVSGSGGTSPWTWSVFSGTTLIHGGTGNPWRDSLAPGTYTVRATNAEGCTTDSSMSFAAPAPILFNELNAKNLLCNASADGSILVSAKSGLAPYQYQLDGGSFVASGSFTGLSAGVHTIRIMDANLCTKDTSVTLTEPSKILFSLSKKNPACVGINDGAVYAYASGGTGILRYALDAGAFGTGATFSGLNAGTYTVTVKDANGCSASLSATLADSLRVRINVLSTATLCAGDANGSLATTVLEGVAPYSFALDAGTFGPSSYFPSLKAGTYVLHMKDKVGCPVDTTVKVAEPAPLVLSFSTRGVSCFDAVDGKVTATASGGTPPYKFSLDGTAGSSSVFTNVAPGAHTLLVTDANGCRATSNADIARPDALSINVNLTAPKCFGGTNGQISILAAGGTLPYLYSADGGSTQTSNVFSGFAAGKHTLHFADANGCAKDTTVDLSEPTQLHLDRLLLTDPTCEGFRDGAISVFVSGGTKPYMYALNKQNFTQASAFNTLQEGSYSIQVQDGNGCTVEGSARLSGYPKINFKASDATSVSCFGASDGAFELAASGGNPPLRYRLEGKTDTLVKGSWTNLKSKSYVVYVYDSTHCMKTFSVDVPSPEQLQLQTAVVHNDCTGNDTAGSITIMPKGGTAPYRYIWSRPSADTTNSISSLANGFYSVKVADAHDCADSLTQEIYYDNCCTPALPNAFTPNNDGKNDVYRILYKGDIQLKEFSIYNRYGQQVFTTTDIAHGWDGTFLGQDEVMGVYYYYVRMICGNKHNVERTFKGDVTLIR